MTYSRMSCVFGLGDTAYEKFCWPAKKLSRRMQSLGGYEIWPRGEGDEQHRFGIDGALDPWVEYPLEVLPYLYPLLSAHKQDTNIPVSRPPPEYNPGDAAVIHPFAAASEVDSFLITMEWANVADGLFTVERTMRESSPINFELRQFNPREIHLCCYIDECALTSLPGNTLRIGIRKGFISLPRGANTPVVCVGPWTGIAPVRTVIEQRVFPGYSTSPELTHMVNEVAGEVRGIQDARGLASLGS
ncbi:hypothetical protein K503DRAFT_787182 [Rhizopogon vinicolor AM-OR11-026]|uniref:Flavodoxin-like domain-containing protein n=1 Tax=Rhizopogon vinicolor AM-OR11-026 TaxID=1314800 RepID=A0A1B7MIP5_9AGAM|nr:hypothetical protein K503DRAFT_787182 [Rhizopogon vinicolor AM-OR11-026]